MSDKEIELLPCPFCGESGPEISEGSTHRWMTISCCGEVRKADISLPANHPVNMKLAAEVWNTRAAHSEAGAWVPIRSVDDLPQWSGIYLWQWNATDGHSKMAMRKFSLHDRAYFAEAYVAWRKIEPYTADSGKEKG